MQRTPNTVEVTARGGRVLVWGYYPTWRYCKVTPVILHGRGDNIPMWDNIPDLDQVLAVMTFKSFRFFELPT